LYIVQTKISKKNIFFNEKINKDDNSIKSAVYSEKMNILVSLDDSSDHFRIYNQSDMKLITKVFPDKF